MKSSVIGAFYFFYFAGMGIWVIFAPKTLTQLGYNEFEIGIIFAVTPLVRFLSPFLFIKAGTISKKLFLSASILTLISTLFFTITISSFNFFILNILIFSLFWVIILPYADSIALEHIPAKSYGKIRLFGSIGFMLIGILLGEKASNPSLVYLLYVIFTLITAIFCFLLARLDVKITIKQTLSESEKNSFRPQKHWQMWLSMFLLQFSFGAFYNFFTIYETAHGVSLTMTTYLWGFGVLCEIAMFLFQGKFIDRINPVDVIKLTIAATVIRWLLLYLFPYSLAASFISQSIHAINFALYTTAVFLYLAKTYPNSKKLAQMFFYGIAYGLGGFLGAIFSGYFYSEQIYLYSAVTALLALIVLLPSKKILLN